MRKLLLAMAGRLPAAGLALAALLAPVACGESPAPGVAASDGTLTEGTAREDPSGRPATSSSTSSTPTTSPLPPAEGCGEPYPLVASFSTYPDPAPVDLGEPLPALVDVWPGNSNLRLDLDHDGQADLALPTTLGSRAEARTSVGTIVIERANAKLALLGIGDVNGDGRDEIGAYLTGGTSTVSEAYLIPSGTSPGTYDPSEVGVRLPPGIVVVMPALDGDGVDLLSFDSMNELAGTTRVLDGSAVAGVRPPAAVPGETVLASVEGRAVAVVALDGRPAIVTFDGTQARLLHDGKVTRFTTIAKPDAGGTGAPTGDPMTMDVEVTGRDGRRFIVIREATRTPRAHAWAIDDPCAAP